MAGIHYIPRDESPVRLAVAGLGRMGGYHIEAARRLQAGDSEEYYKADLPRQIRRLEVCAVCDTDSDRRLAFQCCPGYEEWDELLQKKQRPQLAVIATPTTTHFRLARQALAAGVHCLVEKPLVTTSRECNELMRLADANGCRLLAGHVERYNPVAIKLHELLRAGELTIAEYAFQRTQPHPARIPDDIVTDKLIHDLDLALYLFGGIDRIELLNCRSRHGQAAEVEVGLTHASGLPGRLLVSWLVSEGAGKCRRVRLRTDSGRELYGDFVGKTLRLDNQAVDCGVKGWIAPVNNQIKDQLADFLAYCLEPAPGIPPPLLSPDEILAAVGIIEKVTAAVRV